jgi:hypothetical protein
MPQPAEPHRLKSVLRFMWSSAPGRQDRVVDLLNSRLFCLPRVRLKSLKIVKWMRWMGQTLSGQKAIE